ncbi:hypothetical protein B296_00042832, partial [Ensete ventricosum]
ADRSLICHACFLEFVSRVAFQTASACRSSGLRYIVLKKWLNIRANDSEFSADEGGNDSGLEEDDEEFGGCEGRTARRFQAKINGTSYGSFSSSSPSCRTNDGGYHDIYSEDDSRLTVDLLGGSEPQPKAGAVGAPTTFSIIDLVPTSPLVKQLFRCSASMLASTQLSSDERVVRHLHQCRCRCIEAMRLIVHSSWRRVSDESEPYHDDLESIPHTSRRGGTRRPFAHSILTPRNSGMCLLGYVFSGKR